MLIGQARPRCTRTGAIQGVRILCFYFVFVRRHDFFANRLQPLLCYRRKELIVCQAELEALKQT